MRILPLLLAAAFGSGMANAQSYVDKLKTQDENSIGITFSNYKYKEPSIGMSLKAINFGIEYFGSRRINSEYFGIVEIDYNSGKQDYRSDASGTINDIPTKYLNAKIAIGQDFSFGSYVLSHTLDLDIVI